jgi:hypothetical protein
MKTVNHKQTKQQLISILTKTTNYYSCTAPKKNVYIVWDLVVLALRKQQNTEKYHWRPAVPMQ